MANYITIITPIKASQTKQCRDYLRDNAEPKAGMRCRQDFQFDRIPTLHFASCVILERTDDFDPSLVFEATFDGSKEDFISDLLREAGDGIHRLYQHCVGYPASGRISPELAKEYLINHDVGAHIYFSGSPGRAVAEIRGENGLHSETVRNFAGRQPRGGFAPRLDGLFAQLRGFITGNEDRHWAEQPAPVPWEVQYRKLTAVAAGIAVLAVACLIGAACDWLAVKYAGRLPLLESIQAAFTVVDSNSKRILIQLFPNFPVRLPSELFLPIGLAAIWLVVRGFELAFTSLSKNPRDQFFITRVPLHVLIILRYGVLVLFIGAVLLALLPNMGTLLVATQLSMWLVHVIVGFALLLLIVALVCLQYFATSLKMLVEVKKLKGRQENWRRWRLDVVRFMMVFVLSCVALIVSRYLWPIMGTDTAEWLIYRGLLIAAYAVIGVIVLYGLGVVLLCVARRRERKDKQQFDDPVALVARSAENARKYVREESGNNRFQNHLASLTLVKPGFVHGIALRGTLFLINLLSRFWFNVGTLGDIPTILSARWVLIDSGRRLLFLDNYGGAWDSYLNEFIDMAAVKGLNAIWTNTYVEGQARARCSFPETRFYFWMGAQAEQPFKAYVRESQIETIMWYSAYPTLSVVNINTSTAIRQSLSRPLAPSGVDAIVQNL
jgi:hypothetical protein